MVTIQYSLTNDKGVVLRETSGKPVVYLHGAGVLFPRLERELESHRVGDIVSARLLPDDAFGKRNVDLFHKLLLVNCRRVTRLKLVAILPAVTKTAVKSLLQ